MYRILVIVTCRPSPLGPADDDWGHLASYAASIRSSSCEVSFLRIFLDYPPHFFGRGLSIFADNLYKSSPFVIRNPWRELHMEMQTERFMLARVSEIYVAPL